MIGVLLVDRDRNGPVSYQVRQMDQLIDVGGVKYYRIGLIDGVEAYAEMPSAERGHPPASLVVPHAPPPPLVAVAEPVAQPPAKKAKAAKGRR